MDKKSAIFVGSKQLTIVDKIKQLSFQALVHYPTYQPSAPTAFGPYVMDVNVDAEIIDERFPLVVISHGNGGSHLLYRSISTYLAKRGYIVAMLEHFGNNRNNNSLENTIENLENRPKHISLLIDKMLTGSAFGTHILLDKIAVIGHSMGGYTALALAGGIPYTKEMQRVDVLPDQRIKAIVLLAPGAGWFMNHLNKITIPILLFTAEHDLITPHWNAEIILNGIQNKSQITFQQVKDAGHFSFLSPFPEDMKKTNFLPSTDPLGFNREQFHQQLPVDILQFLNDKLKYNINLLN